jgi:pyruvate,water dikinase
MEELKLETITLGEDPAILVGMVRAYLATSAVDDVAAFDRERRIRSDAEAAVDRELHGFRRLVFGHVLSRTRLRVRDRENLRFERTRVFGVVRRIFLTIGKELADRGHIAEPRDVFYLTLDEVFAHFNGTSATSDLRALTFRRKDEFTGFTAEAAPPDRIETFGPLADWRPVALQSDVTHGDELRGTGCCPGVVRGTVRVVTDPRGARDLAGNILVAERTDPGWTLLFPVCSGLLVQRGSLLSHSAIVAREMGLPCIVGLPGLMSWLQDGDEVEMDGTTGLVRRLTRVEGA